MSENYPCYFNILRKDLGQKTLFNCIFDVICNVVLFFAKKGFVNFPLLYIMQRSICLLKILKKFSNIQNKAITQMAFK